MPTINSVDLQFSEILDALPNSVIWLRAIRNDSGQVVNFRVDYANKKAEEYSAGKYQVAIGTLLLNDRQDQALIAQTIFTSLSTIIETGKPTEEVYFNTILNGWYLTDRSKLGDGVLSVTRDISPLKEAEQDKNKQTELLQTILDTALNNIFVYEAIRDEVGQVQDFRVRLANAVARQDVMNRYGKEVLGNSLLDLRPHSRETGQFNLFSQVIETGQPLFAQHYYPDVKEWYDTSITKLGDGCVVTGINITQQKEDVLQYKQLSDLLNSVLDNSTNGIIAYEAVRDESGQIVDFKFIAVNKAASLLARKTADELIGQSMLDVFPGNLQSGMMNMYVHTVESGERTSMEVHYNYDGLDMWIHASALKLNDGFVVTFSDISEEKQIQRQIRQSADLLQTVINNSPAALVLYEPIRDENNVIIDFRYKLANPIAATATGRPLDYMQGNTLFTMFPGSAQKGFFDHLKQVWETAETKQYEHHFCDDGVDLWAAITMVKQEDDVLTVFQYITDIKRAQQELERSRAELQTVIDTSQTGIFLFNPVRDKSGEVVDFRFQTANRQLASYVGQEPKAVIGALGSTWFPDYKDNGMFDLYKKAYQTGETQRFDFHYDGGGIDAWLDILVTRMGDEVLVTFGDYTPLKQLQQQLEASVVELQRSNRNLEQFAYVASHDLQEPLRKIQAFGDILQTQYAPIVGEAGADMIQRMQSAAARMQVLIKDVLTYSRVSNRGEVHVPVDLSTVAREVINDLETVIDDKKALLTVGSLPTIMGDALQLRQLVQNLISNSLKFAKPDRLPEITIMSEKVRGRESGFVVSPTDSNRLFYLVTITDNGIGFDPQYAERIFQVFQRLHGRSEYQGTGIGLAIVQKVVENHYGYITATGRPGEGATFRLLLPSPSN